MSPTDRPTEQEPLFPTSHEERQAMQEEMLDTLAALQLARDQAKREAAKNKGVIAALEKRGAKLEELLRQSRPRK